MYNIILTTFKIQVNGNRELQKLNDIQTLSRVRFFKLDPASAHDAHRYISLDPDLVSTLRSLCTHPLCWRARLGRLGFIDMCDGGELLKEADEEEGGFVIRKLKR